MPKPNPLSQGLKQQQARQAEFADAPVPVTALPSPGAPGRPRHRGLDRPAALWKASNPYSEGRSQRWRHGATTTCIHAGTLPCIQVYIDHRVRCGGAREKTKNQYPCDRTLQRFDKLAVVRLHSGMAACRPVHVYT